MRNTAFILLAVIASGRAGNNVLLIIADDFGIDSQSLYNTTPGATAPTPNINTLAAGGIRFSNAYACPVCLPTRACMITGRLGFRTGVGEAVTANCSTHATTDVVNDAVAWINARNTANQQWVA